MLALVVGLVAGTALLTALFWRPKRKPLVPAQPSVGARFNHTRDLTEGYVRKGGLNPPVSQIGERPAPPVGMPTRSEMERRKREREAYFNSARPEEPWTDVLIDAPVTLEMVDLIVEELVRTERENREDVEGHGGSFGGGGADQSWDAPEDREQAEEASEPDTDTGSDSGSDDGGSDD